MQINRKFFFGSPPFQTLAGYLARDEDFLNDVRRILELDQDAYTRLATQLAKTDAFLDRSSLASLVSEVLGHTKEAQTIASIIYRIGGMLHDADMPAKEAMDQLAHALEEKAESIELPDRRVLIDRLRTLAADPVGLAKQYKAHQLVDAIGSELDQFQLICDIRPIFDQERDRIEGAIPLTILRLEYSSADGESVVVEMRVTEKQLAELGAKIKTAQRKLNLIKELLANQHLLVPRTKSTVVAEE